MRKKFLVSSNYNLKIHLVNPALQRMITFLWNKSDRKIAAIQKSFAKFVTGELSIFNEVIFEIGHIEIWQQMPATATVGKLSYDLPLKRQDFIKASIKLEYRKLCSAINNTTGLLFGDDLS